MDKWLKDNIKDKTIAVHRTQQLLKEQKENINKNSELSEDGKSVLKRYIDNWIKHEAISQRSKKLSKSNNTLVKAFFAFIFGLVYVLTLGLFLHNNDLSNEITNNPSYAQCFFCNDWKILFKFFDQLATATIFGIGLYFIVKSTIQVRKTFITLA